MKKLWYNANSGGWKASEYELEDDPYSHESAWAIKDCLDREVLIGKSTVIFGFTERDQGESDIVVLDKNRVAAAQMQRRASLNRVA